MTTHEYNNILAVDTSTARLVLALGFGGDRLVQSDNTVDKSHGIVLMKKIEELMQSASLQVEELDGLVVCLGPGSFTGLRIGLAAVKGLAVAGNLPVVGVSLFELFAARYVNASYPVHLLIPSRKGEWYLGSLVDGAISEDNVRVVDEDKLRDTVGQDLCHNLGFSIMEQLPGLHTDSTGGVFTYSGSDLLYLGRERLESGQTADLTELEPLYLQKAIAEKRFEQRQRQQ